MRTLTLGVLIVSTGTLAALPFRRYQAIPDASAEPAQVTGPSQSALDQPTDPEALDASASQETSVASTAGTNMVAMQLPTAPPPQTPNSVATPARTRRERRIDIPLTYEDLAVPLEQPRMIQQRFNATAIVREKQLERERVAGLLMPAMESLAVSQQEELRRVAEAAMSDQATSDDTAGGKAAATLASTTSRHQEGIERLPKAPPAEHERHWIRQPN